MDLFVLNRSLSVKYPTPKGAHSWVADVHGDRAHLDQVIGAHQFDAVVDWIAYTPLDIQRDIELFSGKTRQFIFISSASAYQKPPRYYKITEETPLANPYWEYSRNKIACEERLMKGYHDHGFPVTIVRPSYTYSQSQIPLCLNSSSHPYTVIDRMKQRKKIIVPGDGTSLWTLTWNGDFAKGFVGLLGRAEAIGQAFHITSDEVLTWNQIYGEAASALGVEPQIIHVSSDLIAAYDSRAVGSLIGDKANSVVFDNRKIKQFVPEFAATVSWAEGVRRSLAWYDADSNRRTIDDEAYQLWDKIIAAYERAFPNLA
jgi:nucleoside-diphosphate-sugar epimerase